MDIWDEFVTSVRGAPRVWSIVGCIFALVLIVTGVGGGLLRFVWLILILNGIYHLVVPACRSVAGLFGRKPSAPSKR